MKVGDEVEIRPGIVKKDQNTGAISWTPIITSIVSLKADDNHLMYAIPGGLIGVGLKIDPCLTRSDRLVGNIIGHPN